MHDFKNFPELTPKQMETEYWNSPHKQITENFSATVVKVHDGDTVTVRWKERDFDFPVRLSYINAPELSEMGGDISRDFLKKEILGAYVEVKINPANKVEKWGRLLGDIHKGGLSMSEHMMNTGLATKFEARKDGKIPSLREMLK